MSGVPVRTSPRGVAMLLVLASLVVLIAAVASVAALASVIHMSRQIDRHTAQSQQLLTAVDKPIRHWLRAHSPTATLPPDAAVSGLLVLDDAWTSGDAVWRITVSAWDQLGMVPLELAFPGSPLAQGLSEDTLHAAREARIRSDAFPGLDWFHPPTAYSEIGAVFPRADEAHAATRVLHEAWSSARASNIEDARTAIPAGRRQEAAIGSQIGTHNRAPFAINVNTAPIPLLEAALRATGRGGIEQIIAARSERLAAAAPPRAGGRSGSSGYVAPRIEIVAKSDAWAFRVDARVGSVRRSWWTVYLHEPSSPESSWSFVQRLAIHE